MRTPRRICMSHTVTCATDRAVAGTSRVDGPRGVRRDCGRVPRPLTRCTTPRRRAVTARPHAPAPLRPDSELDRALALAPLEAARGLRRGAGGGMADRQRRQRRAADGHWPGARSPTSCPERAATSTRSRSAPTTCPRRHRALRRCAPRCSAAAARVSTGQCRCPSRGPTAPTSSGSACSRRTATWTASRTRCARAPYRRTCRRRSAACVRPTAPPTSCATPRCSSASTCGSTRPRRLGGRASRRARGRSAAGCGCADGREPDPLMLLLARRRPAAGGLRPRPVRLDAHAGAHRARAGASGAGVAADRA